MATCGAFYAYVGNTSSVMHWSFGAALSFKFHIILFVVVLQVMGLIVARFMFMLTMPHLLRIGTMVLHYLTTYAIRGGVSNDNTYCGTFYVRIANAVTSTNWFFGAILYIHMLVVVEIQEIVILVVYFILVFMLMDLMLIGLLALLHMLFVVVSLVLI